MADFERLLSVNTLQAILAEHGPLPRGLARISGAELLLGLVYHVSQPQGTLAVHLHELTGKQISDSAASQRRLTMPWEVFEALLAQALVPLADPKRQPEAFSAGRRLVGIDGTQFSCANTPRILGTMTKAATRRFEAAFAKLGCAVLVELGTHAPLTAAISAPDLMESEAAPKPVFTPEGDAVLLGHFKTLKSTVQGGPQAPPETAAAAAEPVAAESLEGEELPF